MVMSFRKRSDSE